MRCTILLKTITFLVLFIPFRLSASPQSDPLLDSLFSANTTLLNNVLNNADKYKVQIIYTQIDRDSLNNPSFVSHKYRVNPKDYFYPASTVKLPAAILALEKLNLLNIEGLNKYTPLKIDSSFSGQTPVLYDSSSSNNLPTIANYVKKIFLVSDNNSFNRLYEFLGQQYLNKTLWSKRYCNVKILHRLSSGFTLEENRHTNGFSFYNGRRTIYRQLPQFNPVQYKNYAEDLRQGIGYYQNGVLINKPMDFTYKNYFALETQQQILRSIIFPGAVPSERKFNLSENDYQFLYKYMSMFPRESEYKEYQDYSHYWDSYVKFFIFGNTQDTISPGIRIFNKVGLAYGYLIDNAYIVDFNNNVEFFLSAVIYVNEDGIFNDDKYEYDKTGFPFLANLGKVIYNYELKRNRRYAPDLSRFKLNYSEKE